jgi:hypothetical protein
VASTAHFVGITPELVSILGKSLDVCHLDGPDALQHCISIIRFSPSILLPCQSLGIGCGAPYMSGQYLSRLLATM